MDKYAIRLVDDILKSIEKAFDDHSFDDSEEMLEARDYLQSRMNDLYSDIEIAAGEI